MGNNKKKSSKKKQLPFVSVCTPTFNRRPFIEHMIKCFEHQDYPKNRMEWIIIDDGTDKIEDLVIHIPQVKYYKYDKKMTLGEKRNLMHKKTQGEILVYMDDDDYYPPERVSHAVKKLQSHPSALCAGSSEIYIYFKHINKMYQFGPYSEKHATAGTFAFRRKLLDDSSYDNNASLAEETSFLKNYTVPFVQLDPIKTILVFSHQHNTFDKKKLLDDINPNYVKETYKTVDMFVKEPEMRDFYMNQIEKLLVDYVPGRPNMKPDVLEQIIKIEESRRKNAENNLKKFESDNQYKISVKSTTGESRHLTTEETFKYLSQQQQEISRLSENVNTLTLEKNELLKQITFLTSQINKTTENENVGVYKCEKFTTGLSEENINQLCIA